jgi:hypothetical protein
VSTMDALTLLKDDLKSEDNDVMIASSNRLYPVAMALGPEKTRSQLLPFLVSTSRCCCLCWRNSLERRRW